jgi:NADH dehydrogenase (ubiquinone) 1 alpha subcomplex subunit 5
MSALRRLAPLLARGLKTSTGIVGLPVVPNSREVLMQLSRGILKAVAALPETAHYRRVVEDVYSARLAACQAHALPEEIEAALGLGQMEELIRMARDEAGLIPKMAGACASGAERAALRRSAAPSGGGS